MASADTASISQLIATAREQERVGKLADARSAYESALSLIDVASDDVSAAALLRWIGGTLRGEGKIEAARERYLASLAAAENASNRTDMAHARNWLGVIAQESGQMDAAIEHYHLAYKLAVRLKDKRLTALVRQNLGAAFSIQGELNRGIRFFQKSLDCYRALSDDEAASRVLNNIGLVQADLEEFENAERSFAEAALLAQQMGDLRTQAIIEVNRVDMAVRKGDLEAALKLCDGARVMASRIDHDIALGEIYKWYGIIYRDQKSTTLAESHLAAALDLARRYSNLLLEGEIHREFALLYRTMQRNPAALEALNRAHKIFTELRARRMLSDIDAQLHGLEEIFREIVESWGDSIEQKDLYTRGHCQRVADYSSMLARAAGFAERTLTWFRMGAFLHDVGKTAIPAEILNKRGPLTPEEWLIMRRHTILGTELLSEIEFPWDIRPMVRSHHERWDGTGYPDGLAGEQIPISARILGIVDAYDALTSKRSYRDAFTHDAAMERLRPDAGTVFDPELFELFAKEMRRMAGKQKTVAHSQRLLRGPGRTRTAE